MITYSEPKKETFQTVVYKFEDDKSPIALDFKSVQKAWDFLRTKNLYDDFARKPTSFMSGMNGGYLE